MYNLAGVPLSNVPSFSPFASIEVVIVHILSTSFSLVSPSSLVWLEEAVAVARKEFVCPVFSPALSFP